MLDSLMPKGIIDILVEPGFVRVQYDAVSGSPYRRFYIGLGHGLLCLALVCACLFGGGRNGASSPWQDLHAYPVGSYRFIFPACFVLFILLISAWHLFTTLPAIYPGGQKLECDGLTLTVSRMRWFDWRNQEWISESYLLKDVSRFRYGTLVRGRGNSISGFRIRAAGRNYRLFPNLTSRQVGKILASLEALGLETDRRQKALQRKSKSR